MLTPAQFVTIWDAACDAFSQLGVAQGHIPPCGWAARKRSSSYRKLCRRLFRLLSADPRLAGIELEAKALIGLLYLAPDRAASLPPAVSIECLEIVYSIPAATADDELLADILLAIAAGWRPEGYVPAPSADPRWDDRPWPAAYQELVKMATEFVVKALRDLAGKGLPVRWDQEDVIGWAVASASDFAFGHKYGDTTAAAHFKYLKFWKPGAGHKLPGWLRRAIYGGTRTSFPLNPPNMIRNGLLFPLMKNDGRLAIRPKARKVCLRDGCKREYHCQDCDLCGKSLVPGEYPIFGDELLFVPGQYLAVTFRWVKVEPVKSIVHAIGGVATASGNSGWYIRESLYRSGALRGPGGPVRIVWASGRTAELFVRHSTAPVPVVNPATVLLPNAPGVQTNAVDGPDGPKVVLLAVVKEGPWRDLEKAEQLELLKRLIAELPDGSRQVCSLALEGESLKDIAEHLGKRPKKVEDLFEQGLTLITASFKGNCDPPEGQAH